MKEQGFSRDDLAPAAAGKVDDLSALERAAGWRGEGTG